MSEWKGLTKKVKIGKISYGKIYFSKLDRFISFSKYDIGFII